ncbi:MAG: type I methionyl aminopeptidase [Candidatus Liptonbacteria bacterium]|nr:type I methionyl aminopeptidase [Candidatus Liptonbacteria bacterium]
MVEIKTPSEIELMAEGGRMLAEVLKELKRATRAGVSTKFLDEFAHKLIQDRGATPAFLNYLPAWGKKPYLCSLCASLNDTVVHGLPSDYVIKDGDLVKLDLGLKYKGFYTDTATTVAVGNVSKEEKRLIKVTEDALQKGIAEARAGKTLGDIGSAIQKHVEKNGMSVVKSLTGHGIGRALHEEPSVLNVGNPGHGLELEVGMVLAIEPMVALESGEIKQLKDDSFITRDGSLAAHFEHTVAITEKGPRILTLR